MRPMLNISRYNVLTNGDKPEERLLFNTASGAFAALDAQAAKAYETGCWGEELGSRFSDAGFLTERTPQDELAALQQKFEAQRHDHRTLTLSLAPTYACNYRCPYCYEQGVTSVPGIMDDRVIDGILDFVEARYSEHAFENLSVQWYGGDPSLALDVVEDLSEDMLAFCGEHAIAYSAMILTNCNLIDEPAVQMLAHCKVSSALLTIDGFEETHNKRRVAADGSNSFEKVIAAARLFKAYGIQVNAVMNVDKVNWPEYHDLRDALGTDPGIELSCSRLSDCGHFYGTRDFKKPEFDLFAPEEFARLEHDEFAQSAYSAAGLKELLSAPPRFCSGQCDDYYIIDCIGDVYKCDGYVGDKAHVKFSIFDAPAPDQLQLLSHDPFADEQCSACTLLPICLGNCDWERRTDQMQCHPLKTTLPDYLRDYRTCFDVVTDGFTRLA